MTDTEKNIKIVYPYVTFFRPEVEQIFKKPKENAIFETRPKFLPKTYSKYQYRDRNGNHKNSFFVHMPTKQEERIGTEN